jgi:hypothetical protein
MDFETDETSEYMLSEEPTVPRLRMPAMPTADWTEAIEEWSRGDMDTRAESPKARRQ